MLNSNSNSLTIPGALEINTKVRYDIPSHMERLDMGPRLMSLRDEAIKNLVNEFAKNGLNHMWQRTVDDLIRYEQVYEMRVVMMHPNEYKRLKDIEEKYNRRNEK